MSFREKSAWLMGAILIAGAAFYYHIVTSVSAALGGVSPPIIGFVIAYIVFIVIASIIGMVLLSILSPTEANAPSDEREKIAEHKAGNWSGIILGFGVICSLLHYAVIGNGNLLFHFCFASLMAASIAEYVLQIWLYRRGV